MVHLYTGGLYGGGGGDYILRFTVYYYPTFHILAEFKTIHA